MTLILADMKIRDGLGGWSGCSGCSLSCHDHGAFCHVETHNSLYSFDSVHELDAGRHEEPGWPGWTDGLI